MRLAVRPPVPRPPPRSLGKPGSAVAWEGAGWTGGGGENRYSRRVALLKRVLPAIGLALLLLITIWPRLAPLWERMRLGFPAIDLRDARELRMLNPRYLGTDRLNRPFVVTANVAHQVPDRQDLMSLEAPRADMKTHAGADIVVTAATGMYQSPAQLLDAFGDVTLVHQNGTRFVTERARLDIAHNAAQGDDPIEGHGPSGDVKAQGFRIFDKGDTVLFTGRSDMLLKSAKLVAGGSQPPALPPDVVTTAARVEAKGKPMLAAATPHGGPVKPATNTRKPAPAPVANPTAAKPAVAKPVARSKGP
jgi:lipopolysaccharide export system protein LptC